MYTVTLKRARKDLRLGIYISEQGAIHAVRRFGKGVTLQVNSAHGSFLFQDGKLIKEVTQ